MRSSLRRRGTSHSGTWIVTGTTARSCDQIIMTGVAALPQWRRASSPRNSVWPGMGEPRACRATSFMIGAVTTARARPWRTSLHRPLDRLEHGCGRLDPRPSGGGGHRARQGDDGQAIWEGGGGLALLDLRDFDVEACRDGAIADQGRIGTNIERRQLAATQPGHGRELGADTGRLPHRDGDRAHGATASRWPDRTFG